MKHKAYKVKLKACGIRDFRNFETEALKHKAKQGFGLQSL